MPESGTLHYAHWPQINGTHQCYAFVQFLSVGIIQVDTDSGSGRSY